MKSLADEILDVLAGLMRDRPNGASVEDIAKLLSASTAHVRAAMKALDVDRRAVFLRYPGSRRMRLVPAGFDLGAGRNVCRNCGVVFERPRRAKRLNCTRACAVAWSWKSPETRDNRLTGLREAKATPEASARATETNLRRWAQAGERERLAELSRERWADPAMRAVQSAAIQAVNGSAVKRAEAAAIRKALWEDPDYRAKNVEAVRASHGSPEYRAAHSERMKARWRDPVLRQKYIAANRKRAKQRGEAVRGKPQSAEHIRKRAEATGLALRGRKQSPEHIRKRLDSIRRNRELAANV